MTGKRSNPSFTRRDLLRATAGGLAASAIPGCSALNKGVLRGFSAAGKRPNVIVLFDDQLRADVCGAYGGGKNITTPNIDRLAGQGMTFNNATSTCPLCTPYRGMMQTGRYPTHSGIVLNWINANPKQPTVARVFAGAGYDTGFIGKWHLSSGGLTMAGKHQVTKEDRRRIIGGKKAYRKINPETEFVPPGPQRLGYKHWEAFNFHCDFNTYYYYRDEPKKFYSGKYETDTQIDQAIAFMKQRNDSSPPFFMMIAPHPPHPPFKDSHCPKGYVEKVRDDLQWTPNVTPNHKKGATPRDARYYYAMSKNVDDNLGRLMAYLDESGLTDDTILVFTSDHGEMLGSHDRRNKMVPYAEAVNIPMIIRWPGRISAGARTDTLHTPMDHFPTLCSLAGVGIPDTVDGMDLSREMLGKGKADRDAIMMMNHTSHWDYFDSGTRWPEWRGVRTGRFTYCKWLKGKEELYDNIEDPYQMNNLAEGNRDLPVLKKMRSRLKDFMADAHDEFLPGTAYADWYDDKRNPLKTALGPV